MPYTSGLIDGYALKMTKRTAGNRPELLLSTMMDVNFNLRLAVDGRSLIGTIGYSATVVEHLDLSCADNTVTAEPLTTSAMTAAIRKSLVKNSSWRGAIFHVPESRSIEITMRVAEVGQADDYTFEFLVPRVAGGRAQFMGTLNIDDLTANTHCLKLSKTKGGAGTKSLMFDSETGDYRRLKLLFSPDGTTMYGLMSPSFGEERTETVTLRLQGAQRPAAVPVPAAAAAPAIPMPTATPSSTPSSSGPPPSPLLKPVGGAAGG